VSGTVELHVAVVVEAMGDGRVRAAPLFERSWMTHEEEDDALESLRSFCETRLAEAAPSEVARILACAAEAEHAVRVVTVKCAVSEHDTEPLHFDVATVVLGPRAADLSRLVGPGRGARAAPSPPMSSPLPAWWGTRDVWIAVPVIDHVLRVPDGITDEAALDAAIAAEVQRVLVASARDPLDVLAALPCVSTRVERLALQVNRPERLDAETRAAGQRASSEKLRLEDKRRFLERMGRRVERRAKPARRDALVEKLETFVSSHERLAVLVRGPELAGKSSLIEHVLGKGSRLAFAVPVARLLAGDGAFGEWQTQVEETFRAAELLDAVVYVEDLGSLALERPGSPIDLAGAIAPFLEARRVRFVGELRDAELDRFESRHRGLASALVPLRVPALDTKETCLVLDEAMGVGATLPPEAPTATPKRRLDADAIRALVSLVERYQPYRALPGEALRTAAALRDALEVPRREDGTVPAITRAEVVRALAERLGLPISLLREDVPLPPDEIASALRQRVIGQDEAVLAVAATLGVVKAGLSAPGKPIATFLFAGPTGTGKTELARALASFLFGSADALARFDMSEYMDPWSGDRLIRGTDRDDGLLTRRARERPFSVLLLDEIEKAHPAVFDLLLQLLGEGRLTDARGKTAFFHNTLVVMTSNLGARDDRAGLGFDPEVRSRGEVYLRAVRETTSAPSCSTASTASFRSGALADAEVALDHAPLRERASPGAPVIADPRHTLEIGADALGMPSPRLRDDDATAALGRCDERWRTRSWWARRALLARLGPEAERAQRLARVSRSPDERSGGHARRPARPGDLELVEQAGSCAGTPTLAARPRDRAPTQARRAGVSSRASRRRAPTAYAHRVAELARAAQRNGRRRPRSPASSSASAGYGPRIEKVDRAAARARGRRGPRALGLRGRGGPRPHPRRGRARRESARAGALRRRGLLDLVGRVRDRPHGGRETSAHRARALRRDRCSSSDGAAGRRPAPRMRARTFPAGVGPPARQTGRAERGVGPASFEAQEARTLLRGPNARFTSTCTSILAGAGRVPRAHVTSQGLVRIVHEQQKLGRACSARSDLRAPTRPRSQAARDHGGPEHRGARARLSIVRARV
jgi:hypothetical protein